MAPPMTTTEYEYWPPVTDQDVGYLLSATQKRAGPLYPQIALCPFGQYPTIGGDGSGRASKELSRKDEIWTS